MSPERLLEVRDFVENGRFDETKPFPYIRNRAVDGYASAAAELLIHCDALTSENERLRVALRNASEVEDAKTAAEASARRFAQGLVHIPWNVHAQDSDEEKYGFAKFAMRI